MIRLIISTDYEIVVIQAIYSELRRDLMSDVRRKRNLLVYDGIRKLERNRLVKLLPERSKKSAATIFVIEIDIESTFLD